MEGCNGKRGSILAIEGEVSSLAIRDLGLTMSLVGGGGLLLFARVRFSFSTSFSISVNSCALEAFLLPMPSPSSTSGCSAQGQIFSSISVDCFWNNLSALFLAVSCSLCRLVNRVCISCSVYLRLSISLAMRNSSLSS